MAQAAQTIVHSHIVRNPEICGGSPILTGTRFPVRAVVHYILQLGLTPEELIEKFSYLSLAQVYNALAYYYENREEIERDITDNLEKNSRLTFSK